ncbi:MAG TPA: Mur ligase family protein [Egibacteraceae bacterium]|nr:Mur ligase family protein [Egibacteraceae bacterium]
MSDPGSYADSVAALYARQPERMVPDLDRMRTLVELLGRPDQTFPAIQLTGTNGKTSTAAMVTCLLGALGLAAGTFTSPHLQDVRERIRVGGEPISREAFTEGLDYLGPFLAEVDVRHHDRVTFFEVLTALALVHFADRPVDVGVFEVGMGGRWDATNLVRGEVAVLTGVGVDHAELGPDPASVAREKVGIIKDGAVVVAARQEPAVSEIIVDAAERAGGRLVVAGRDFDVASRELAVGGQLLTLRGVTGDVEDVYLPLHGVHQALNAACALAAVEGFLGFAGNLDPAVIREGFAAVRSPGRLEVVRRPHASTVVLDGAHNPLGAQALASALEDEFAFRHRVLVLGVLGDKDVEGIVDALLEVAEHVVVTEPPSTRAAPADRLEKLIRRASRAGTRRAPTVEVAPDVASAVELASGLAAQEDAVVVTGSLYTVGAARAALGLAVA